MNDVAIQTAGERQRLMRDAVVNNLTAPVSAIIGILPIMGGAMVPLGQLAQIRVIKASPGIRTENARRNNARIKFRNIGTLRRCGCESAPLSGWSSIGNLHS